MKVRLVPAFRAVVLCCLVATLPALSQDNGGPKTRPAPGGQQGGRPGGEKPGGRPSPGGGTKPTQPARPNPGGGKPGGGRPNPGGGNPGRPSPGKPTPGRPTPGRPSPGRPTPGRPSPGHGGGRPPSHGRPPNWGRPPANRPNWSFRPQNRSYLHTFYFRFLANVNRANRPVFAVGGYLPYGDLGYLTALPPQVYAQMPPPPPGYQMGYWDGYVITYDPLSGYILDVVDLLQ
jgi:hypothetical protein